MKTILQIIFALTMLVCFTNCNSKAPSINQSGIPTTEITEPIIEAPRPLTEAELKQQLMDKECEKGAQYLDGKLSYTPIYKKLLSLKVNGLKLSCKISNKSTLATFKDIKGKVTFKSKTDVIILEKEFDIYEFINPNGELVYNTEIEISNQQYDDIASFTWEILKASCK